MNRYELKNQLGDGTYGSVVKAIKKGTREVVAIKRMKKKYSTFTECLDLREVKTLRDLSHPHIVRLLEVIRENDSTLCFVFEHMDANLYEVMKQYQNSFSLQAMAAGGVGAATGQGGAPGLGFPAMSTTGLTIIPTSKIQSILFQVLQALSFMHSKGYFHRDIKPENLLMRGDVVKVADLGLAREILSLPPYTDYVSTRWYRAPEVLLRSPHYNAPIDIFAVGCILAELYSLQPLFPGSSELDQISRICGLLGGPNPLDWPEGATLVNTLNLRLGYQHVPSVAQAVVLASTTVDDRILQNIPQLSQCPVALQFLKGLLILNPKQRLTAKESLDHPFFSLPSDMMETAVNTHSTNLYATVQKEVVPNHHQSSISLGFNQMLVGQHQLQQANEPPQNHDLQYSHHIQQQYAQPQHQQDAAVAAALVTNELQRQHQQQQQQQQQQNQQFSSLRNDHQSSFNTSYPQHSDALQSWSNHHHLDDGTSLNHYAKQGGHGLTLPLNSNHLALAAVELGKQMNLPIEQHNSLQQAAEHIQQSTGWQQQQQEQGALDRVLQEVTNPNHLGFGHAQQQQQHTHGLNHPPDNSASLLLSAVQQQVDNINFNFAAAATACGLAAGGVADGAVTNGTMLDPQHFNVSGAAPGTHHHTSFHQTQSNYGEAPSHGFANQNF